VLSAWQLYAATVPGLLAFWMVAVLSDRCLQEPGPDRTLAAGDRVSLLAPVPPGQHAPIRPVDAGGNGRAV
jgi:hypothetical protein